jgi:hypothetical protein
VPINLPSLVNSRYEGYKGLAGTQFAGPAVERYDDDTFHTPTRLGFSPVLSLSFLQLKNKLVNINKAKYFRIAGISIMTIYFTKPLQCYLFLPCKE